MVCLFTYMNSEQLGENKNTYCQKQKKILMKEQNDMLKKRYCPR